MCCESNAVVLKALNDKLQTFQSVQLGSRSSHQELCPTGGILSPIAFPTVAPSVPFVVQDCIAGTDFKVLLFKAAEPRSQLRPPTTLNFGARNEMNVGDVLSAICGRSARSF